MISDSKMLDPKNSNTNIFTPTNFLAQKIFDPKKILDLKRIFLTPRKFFGPQKVVLSQIFLAQANLNMAQKLQHNNAGLNLA